MPLQSVNAAARLILDLDERARDTSSEAAPLVAGRVDFKLETGLRPLIIRKFDIADFCDCRP